MGSKGYFNPRLKTKDFNKKLNATFQKPVPQRGNKKYHGFKAWFEKRAKRKADSESEGHS